MIKENVHFSYDGTTSYDMGILNVSIDGGMFEEHFVAPRNIREEKTKGREKPYFFGIEYDPIEFTLQLAFSERYTDASIKDVANWLCRPYYRPFHMVDYPNKIIYCMLVDDPKLVHNGLKQGYLEVTMRANSPFVYSQESIDTYTGLTSDSATPNNTIIFHNYGNVPLRPELWITKNNVDGDVKIVNSTFDNKEFLIKNLAKGEEVYFDCYNRYIKSSFVNYYRYDDFNGEYLTLIYGENNLVVTGDCDIKLKYRYIDLL